MLITAPILQCMSVCARVQETIVTTSSTEGHGFDFQRGLMGVLATRCRLHTKLNASSVGGDDTKTTF